jgi:hypothetical protein
MSFLSRRITNLEARAPTPPLPGKMIPLSDLDPEVAEMYLAHDGDVTTMTMDELDALEAELLRFSE